MGVEESVSSGGVRLQVHLSPHNVVVKLYSERGVYHFLVVLLHPHQKLAVAFTYCFNTMAVVVKTLYIFHFRLYATVFSFADFFHSLFL